MTTTNKQAALEYLQRHWSVIPMHSHDKRPIIRWQEFQYRLATTSEVEEWFRRWSDGNVGIVTGAVSRLVVLDIDPKHGGDESLAHLIREHGPLPHTIEALTGGGGRHIYFAHPGGILRNKVGIFPGIDIRGDGGCIVAPPSVHTCGKAYKWVKGKDPLHTSLAPLPAWLLRETSSVHQGTGHRLDHWRNLVREGVPEGRRNNTIASLTGHLLWHGVDTDVVLELLLCWNRVRCRPPLSEEEVIRTVDNISLLHERP